VAEARVVVHCEITREPLDPAALIAAVADPAHGAAAVFVGTVRDLNLGQAVDSVEYEAYLPMAERVLHDIADRAGTRPGTGPARIAVAHRTGRLDVGEASVVIAVGTPHRAEAFDVCRRIIEEIKEQLPVWKRERGPDGDSRWLGSAVGQAAERDNG
jgi:molybdopterin synthase catalytic subunit